MTPEHTPAYSEWLTQVTADQFKTAAENQQKLEAAVKVFITAAKTAGFELEEIENILGVNDNCIMDLAELSETDEDIVIDHFEHLTEE
jgi:hypothetical protein